MSPRYTTLMASLPPLGGLFESRTPAISRLKLERRLRLLEPQDRRRLELTVSLLSQSMRPLDQGGGPGDDRLLEEARAFFAEVSHPLLRHLVTHRLDQRTVLAALRRRHRGEAEPPLAQPWGFGAWVPAIQRHWKEPTFRLEAIFPWIVETVRLLEVDDLINLERLQFAVIWKDLDRVSLGHHFDFEAVMIYLARWSLVERWCSFDAQAATARFRQLVAAGLGSFAAASATP
ncbi:DUF2764 family protein [Cyanobium sp. LEGE 06143]|uniref:DUF2764 family protein n=1 Tax=Cyanobium sp. LEGE 06143 TaxID=945727 RepID=UPI00187E23B4|nr:DUF2764 family protein [Cyanobium sp. LEGE 06143]MBE9171924.1 DUF2764 family protein [Cyanobium sp. LEGE 06143]